jgi:hypothetical protein
VAWLEETKTAYRILVRKPLKMLLRRMKKLKDDIKLSLKEVDCENVNSLSFAQVHV